MDRFLCSISLTICGMMIAHSSPCQPSSMRSSISSLYFSSFFGRGGGRVDITSYHHCWIWGLFLEILIILINNFSMEGNSEVASSSSAKMAESITLISSRDVSIKIREVRVSSVLKLPLHCSSSYVILEIIRYKVSLTLRSPRGDPCVFHVCKRLSHALIISSTLSR